MHRNSSSRNTHLKPLIIQKILNPLPHPLLDARFGPTSPCLRGCSNAESSGIVQTHVDL